MLDVKSDQVPWAVGNAWAPCIEEKKQKDGTFKYYFYYSAHNPKNNRKSIGVAISDNPTGPFVDFGKPIVESAAIQQNRQWFENGKQIVEYIIQLAQMAAKINPLRSKTGVEITKDLFGDGDLSRWISGRQVSVEDIGTIIGKKDVANSDVDKFLSDMGFTGMPLPLSWRMNCHFGFAFSLGSKYGR